MILPAYWAAHALVLVLGPGYWTPEFIETVDDVNDEGHRMLDGLISAAGLTEWHALKSEWVETRTASMSFATQLEALVVNLNPDHVATKLIRVLARHFVEDLSAIALREGDIKNSFEAMRGTANTTNICMGLVIQAFEGTQPAADPDEGLLGSA
jgi:hypothetical protein